MSEELYLVSNLLYDKKFIPLVAGKIRPDDFDDKFLGEIYAELLQEKDVIGISKDLDVKPEKIMEIACVCGIGSVWAVKTYGEYIFERNKNRKLKEIANAEQINANQLIEVNSQQFADDKPQDESEAYLKMVEDVYSGKPDYLTIHTGFYNVDDKIGGFRKSEAIFIGGRPASGKGLTLDTKLLTPKGWIENKDVKVGDTLIGRNGKPTKVIGVFKQPLKDCYKITFKDGRTITCDESHLWQVYCSKWKQRERVISAAELYKKMLCVRYQRRISIPSFSGMYGEEKKFVIPPYVMGVLLGDGCLTNGLRYNKPSITVLEKVKNNVPSFVVVTERKGNNIGLTNWNEALSYIKNNGLNVRSYEKFIPQEYFHASYEQRKLLFDGLMDTDGYLHKEDYEYSTTSERLKDDVMQLAYSLGYNCSCSQRMGKYKKHGETVETRINYRVHISHKKPLTIKTIERVKSVPTQCIAVDNEEKLFVAENYIVTHNTTFAINVAYNMARNKKKVLFCSLEMGARELHERLVKHITGIDHYKNATQHEIDKIIKTSKAIKDRLPLIIYDKAGMKLEDIYSKTLSEKPDVVFIDHLAILKSAQKFKSRYEEVSYLSAKIKELARQYDIPVICLCQLNRNLEARDIKAPSLSDIRDSGSVEQDGDIIGFIYRPEYHLQQQEPDLEDKKHIEWEEKLRAVKGKAKFIIAKNRRGFTGSFLFGFKGEVYSFFEL